MTGPATVMQVADVIFVLPLEDVAESSVSVLALLRCSGAAALPMDVAVMHRVGATTLHAPLAVTAPPACNWTVPESLMLSGLRAMVPVLLQTSRALVPLTAAWVPHPALMVTPEGPVSVTVLVALTVEAFALAPSMVTVLPDRLTCAPLTVAVAPVGVQTVIPQVLVTLVVPPLVAFWMESAVPLLFTVRLQRALMHNVDCCVLTLMLPPCALSLTVLAMMSGEPPRNSGSCRLRR